MIFSNVYLATLDAARAEMAAEQGANYQADDTLLLGFIADATAMAHQFCNRAFLPSRQTRTYDAIGELMGARSLPLQADLLEAVSITNGDGTVLTSDQYRLRDWPYHEIILKTSSGITWTYEDGDYEDAIEVDGIWGYHESYGTAWVDSGDAVQAGGIDASVTAIDVADADGSDARFHAPRFQVGQLLRIDDEYLIVVAVDATANTLTVRRGQLGTTAAAHDAGATIATYAPMRNIARAVTALAIWLYRNKATQGDAVHLLADGSRVVENQVPSNIRETLSAYVWRGWGF